MDPSDINVAIDSNPGRASTSCASPRTSTGGCRVHLGIQARAPGRRGRRRDPPELRARLALRRT
jgi:hypothetical protein